MTGPVFVVHGGRELSRTMKQAAQDLADLKTVNKRVGELVAGAARSHVPVRSGRLVGSLRHAAAASAVTIGSSLRYAGPIHWGWPAHHIAADPFLSDAATSTEDVWVGYYFEEVQTIVNRVEGA